MNFKDHLSKDLEDVFFNSEEFSVLANFRDEPIAVIFNEKDDVVFDTGLDSDVSTSVPSVLCKSKDVLDAEHSEVLVVNGVTYYIIDMDPIDMGTRKIYLSEDRP